MTAVGATCAFGAFDPPLYGIRPSDSRLVSYRRAFAPAITGVIMFHVGRRARRFVFVLLAVCVVLGCGAEDGSARPGLSNPIAPLRPSEASGLSPEGLDSADPFIFTWNGRYWLTHTGQTRVILRSAETLGGLASAPVDEVWRPGEGGAPAEYATNVWAPEFHRMEGPSGWRWYLYVAADTGQVIDHRMLVLESERDDPRGPYTFKGLLQTGGFAIDATILAVGDRTYALYAGHTTSSFIPEVLYIAELADPWTFASPPVVISTPTHPWEQEGLAVNEGPQVLFRGPWLHVIFSADACTGPTYKLGRLTVPVHADLLDPATWRDAKAPEPLFVTSLDAGVYGPGHGSFFQSLDGREDWHVYHAADSPDFTCLSGVPRLARAQRFTWNEDDSPDFGAPLPLDAVFAPPSGDSTLTQQFEALVPVATTLATHEVEADAMYVGGRAAALRDAVEGSSVTYRLNVPEDRTYAVVVRMGVGPATGIVRLEIDGLPSPAGDVDGYRPERDAVEYDFGPVRLPRGHVNLRFTVAGKSSASDGFAFSADQVRLQ